MSFKKIFLYLRSPSVGGGCSTCYVLEPYAVFSGEKQGQLGFDPATRSPSVLHKHMIGMGTARKHIVSWRSACTASPDIDRRGVVTFDRVTAHLLVFKEAILA